MSAKIAYALTAAFVLFVLPAASATLSSSQVFAAGPAVDEISTEEVRGLLDQQRRAAAEAQRADRQPPPADFVLVDVRSETETNIAIIPGAITREQFEMDREKYAGRTVIAYCAVGGRSTAYATKLANQGVQVKNYKGSMLAWVTAEQPLVTLDGKPTTRVFHFSENHKIPAKYQQVSK